MYLGVRCMCLESSPALDDGGGGGVGVVKVFGWGTSCSQKWSDLILLCSYLKPPLTPHYTRAAFKCFIPDPWGPLLA